MFTKSDFQRILVSSVGALAVSAACVLGAVGPAKAATLNAPLTAADWQSDVQGKIERIRETSSVAQPSKLAQAEVAVHFTAAGDFAGATLAKSSGNARVDSRAVRVANRIAYPALPQGYRGAEQTVAMKLYFGTTDMATDYAALQARTKTIQIASADRGNGTQIAAR